MKWFEQSRMAWIAETLQVFGYLNREHLQRKFGISRMQASIDLRRFQQRHPGVMAYNTSAKRYERSEPQWPHPTPEGAQHG